MTRPFPIIYLTAFVAVLSVSLASSRQSYADPFANCPPDALILGHDAYNTDICTGIAAYRAGRYGDAVASLRAALGRELFEQPNFGPLPWLVRAYLGAGREAEAASALRLTEVVYAIEFGILRCTDDETVFEGLPAKDGRRLFGPIARRAFEIMCYPNARASEFLFAFDNLSSACGIIRHARDLREQFADPPVQDVAQTLTAVDPIVQFIDREHLRAITHRSKGDAIGAGHAQARAEVALGLAVGIYRCGQQSDGQFRLFESSPFRNQENPLMSPSAQQIGPQLCPAQVSQPTGPLSFGHMLTLCRQYDQTNDLREEGHRPPG